MIFIQAIVFYPYCMELTSFISIGLQFSHYGSSKLRRNVSKSIFFSNFELPLSIFQNKVTSNF